MTDTPTDAEQPGQGPPSPDRGEPAADLIAAAGKAFTDHEARIRKRASFRFRHLQANDREDAVAEVEAFAWYEFLTLTARGDDPSSWVSPIVDYAVGRYNEGRRFAGRVPVQDVLSDQGQRRRGQFATSLPLGDDDRVAQEVRDSLRHCAAGPAEEAILSADYEAFLATVTDKERSLAETLRSGLSMADVARACGISNAAVQDMRKTLASKWAARAGYEDSFER